MPFPFAKFFGNTIGEGAAFAAGLAIAPTLSPILRELENETWSTYPNKPADAVTMALGVAQGQVTKTKAYKWAAENGYGADVMDALVSVANVGPGVGQAFRLWRRALLDDTGFRRALLRVGLEPEWIDAMVKTKTDPLDVADLARAIHKSLIPDPGLLAVPQPSGTGNVPAYPVYDVDALAEALAGGYDKTHLGVLVGLQGNPMGAHEAAQALFRGVLEQVDYDRAIAEGNTRNEWGHAIIEQSRQIVTTHEAVENAIRGWSDKPTMYDRAGRHGMTEADAEVLWENAGRPLSWHQVWIGLERGGIYDGPIDQIDPAFLSALRQSNVRPEYYNLAWAQRYNYPAAFVLRTLAQDGDLNHAEVVQILKFEGWEPTLAETVATKWTGGAGQTTSPVIKSHTTSAIGAVRKAYIPAQVGADQARADLGALGVSASDQAGLLAVWDVQRRATLPTLTTAQIVKANGNTMTYPEAHAALAAQGYPEAEIAELLGRPPTT